MPKVQLEYIGSVLIFDNLGNASGTTDSMDIGYGTGKETMELGVFNVLTV